MTARVSSRYALFIWLAGVLVCTIVILRTEFSADLSAFLPRTPTPVQQVLVGGGHAGLV